MSMKEYYKDRKNQITTLVFLITMLIACAPLVSKYCINGHDLEYHLLRIESLKEGIRIGKPFLRVNTLFFGNAGYASSMFYPDILLYIPAFLRLLGLSINFSYHIYVAVCIILCYLSAYLCIKKMTGSSYGAMIAAVTITLSQYHLDDIYIRSAAGEYQAFIFIPIIVYGIYNVIYEGMDKPRLFVLGYAGLLLSHTSTFVMCTAFGMAVFIIYFRRILSDRKVLKRLFVSVLVTLLLTCFYWLPMLEQFMDSTFYVSTPWMQPEDEAVNFLNIFGSQFPALGYCSLLILIPRIFMKKTGNDKNLISYADLLILAGALFAMLSCDLLPWSVIGRYLSFIQFPWRFFIMSSVLFAMAAGLMFSAIIGKDEEAEWGFKETASSFMMTQGPLILIFVLVINGISGIGTLSRGSQGYYDYSDDYYSYKPYTANVIAGEWLPDRVKDKESLVEESEVMISDKGNEIDHVRVGNTIEADIRSDFEYADVPFIYYLGYKADLLRDDGSRKELRVTGEGHNGMCRVYLKDMGTGRLKVYYGGTYLSALSSCISLLAFITVIFIGLRNGKKAVKEKK